MKKIINILEEILIFIGLVFFLLCGYSINITFGLLFTSIGAFIGAIITVFFKKVIANQRGE